MKTMLITGGAEGLGRAMAELFCKDYQVVILARESDNPAQAAAEIGCDFVIADVGDWGQVHTAVESVIAKYGTIDVLINNAGQWIGGLLEANDAARIRSVIETNTLGTIFLTRAVLPHMKSAGQGKIVNIISEDGLEVKPEHSVYVASKWAITGFTRALELDLAHTGVSVQAIYPSRMCTNLFKNAGAEVDTTGACDPKVIAAQVGALLQ
jgi:NAD(P)-dependent dehydrogenase (short-subunit alcohol dehydrogenase family)